VIDVITGQCNTKILELTAGDYAALVRCRDGLELLGAENRVAREPDFLDEDLYAIGNLFFLG
jgi:porphobilinogen deaminase